MVGEEEGNRSARSVLFDSTDPVVLRALRRVADSAGLRVLDGASIEAPDVVVVDLDLPDAIAVVEQSRRQFPLAFIAGHLGVPQRERWIAAERAGCDLIASRGAFAAQLVRRLPAPGEARRRRVRLAESADLPGRIGLVAGDVATPCGPVALYQLRGILLAVEDVCPHAGATLSRGELTGSVLTCPAHGSQFDVSSGERLRGPADCAIRVFDLVEEEGSVYLILGPDLRN